MGEQARQSVVITETAPPISSELIERPSIFDLVKTYGTRAVDFVPEEIILEYFERNFPSEEYNFNLLDMSFRSFLSRLMDRFAGPKTTKHVEGADTLLVLAELHRPKINECKASFEITKQTKDDFSFEISIAGVGGGANKSKFVGYSTKIDVIDNCAAIAVPVRIELYEDEYRDGSKVPRAEITSIGERIQSPELIGRDDHCGIEPDKVDAARWQNEPFQVHGTQVRTESVTLESSYEGKGSLKLELGPLKFGPAVSVKFVKKAVFSYSLKGPHTYNAYLPLDSVGYCWNWT